MSLTKSQSWLARVYGRPPLCWDATQFPKLGRAKITDPDVYDALLQAGRLTTEHTVAVIYLDPGSGAVVGVLARRGTAERVMLARARGQLRRAQAGLCRDFSLTEELVRSQLGEFRAGLYETEQGGRCE